MLNSENAPATVNSQRLNLPQSKLLLSYSLFSLSQLPTVQRPPTTASFRRPPPRPPPHSSLVSTSVHRLLSSIVEPLDERQADLEVI
jgi:hypothetical protein